MKRNFTKKRKNEIQIYKISRKNLSLWLHVTPQAHGIIIFTDFLVFKQKNENKTQKKKGSI